MYKVCSENETRKLGLGMHQHADLNLPSRRHQIPTAMIDEVAHR